MTAANPSQALATVLVDELARNRITHVCLAPGSRSTALAMAAHARPEVAVHVGVDERSVGFLALGIARATGWPAAVVSTSGTAAVNFHPPVVEADAARVPLLVLTADRPPERRHTGANQTIDQLGLYSTAVRWFCEMGAPEDRAGSNAYWRSTVCRAVGEAVGVGGRPGPVHVNLAFREPLVPAADDGRSRAAPFAHPTAGRSGGRPWTAVRRGPRPASDAELTGLADRIAATERGLVVAGDTPVAAEPVVALARAAGWPLLAEPLSGARTGPTAVSTYHLLLSHPTFARAHRPDLVVRIGRAALSRPLLDLLDETVPQVLVDPDGAWLDPRRTVGQVVAADPAATCARLADRLETRGDSSWLTSWCDAERRARHAVDTALDAEQSPSEPRTARDVADLVPDGGTLVVASSMPVRDLDRFMRPRSGLTVLGNRGASGIDGLVSTAIGAALARTSAPAGRPADDHTAGDHRPTVALAGDLSLLHDRNGFLLLDEHPDVVVVVVNNDGGGIFSFLPQAGFPDSFERLFGTPHGVDPAEVAATHNLDHRRVEQAGELKPVLAEACRTGGMHLIEVRTDRDANTELHRRLQQQVTEALEG